MASRVLVIPHQVFGRVMMAEYEYVPSNLRLARFPVHWISSAPVGERPPRINMPESDGCWWVNYGDPPRPPGALGMRVDRLVVTPAIYAEPEFRMRGRLIRLGSLRSIAKVVGSGVGNTTDLKEALRRNASVQILAWPVDRDWQTRYDVYLPGDRLPNSMFADVCYVRLSDFYRKWLGEAAWSIRLRRDLLRVLPPRSARLYEILASLRRHSAAALLSSDIHRYIPLTQGTEPEWSTSRLDELHKPLMDRGVIAGVTYEPIEFDGPWTSEPPDDREEVHPDTLSFPWLYGISDRIHKDCEVHYLYGDERGSAFGADGAANRVDWKSASRLRLGDTPAI